MKFTNLQQSIGVHRRSSAVSTIFLTFFLAVSSLGVEASVTAKDVWVRGMVPAQNSTGAYATFEATEDLKLVAVKSPLAKSAELHASEMKDGVMRMEAVDAVPIPAGQRVELKPGGYHVMLLEMKKPVGEHDRVPLTFTFEARNGTRHTLDVLARVRPLGQ